MNLFEQKYSRSDKCRRLNESKYPARKQKGEKNARRKGYCRDPDHMTNTYATHNDNLLSKPDARPYFFFNYIILYFIICADICG